VTLGTSWATVKQGLVDRLLARPALAEVAVSYEAPLQPEDVVGPTGKHEAIYFVDVDDDVGEQDNKVICSLPLRIDEEYSVPLCVQVLRPESDGTQYQADLRVDELLGEVLTVVANLPTLGVEAGFQHLLATRGSLHRRTGVIGQGAGHGASAVLDLRVEARLIYPAET